MPISSPLLSILPFFQSLLFSLPLPLLLSSKCFLFGLCARDFQILASYKNFSGSILNGTCLMGRSSQGSCGNSMLRMTYGKFLLIFCPLSLIIPISHTFTTLSQGFYLYLEHFLQISFWEFLFLS